MLRTGVMSMAALGVMFAAAGCVKREIEITSDPTGAQVLLNGRDVGATPVVIEFTFDGTYDVRLHLDGYDAVTGSGTTKAPVWDFVGADFVAEISPAKLHRIDRWHFTMIPEAQAEVGLLDRARSMREGTTALPANPEGAPQTRDQVKKSADAPATPAGSK